MAFIYKYVLKNPSNRKKEDLTEHKENIKKAIKKVFPKSCKEVLVQKDYFEFKLYLKASDGELRKMGRELVKKDNALDRMKKVKEKGSELFIRVNSSYYAYIEHFSKDDNEIILDVDMVQKFDLPMYTKSLENHNDIGKREVFRNMDTYKLSLYIDNWKEDKRILKILDKLKEGNWYLIQGKLSNTEDESEIFLDFTAWHRSDNKDDSKLISGFKLTLIEEVNDIEIVELDRFFSIEGIEYRDAPTYISELDKFKVIIYNVGQGLCSAVCDGSNHPYIYFDFGRGYWRNKCTYPGGMYYDTTHNPPIILSHWHADHYILVNDCKEALDCEWIVPGNIKGPSIPKLYSELSARDNLVVITSDFNLIIGKIFVGTGNSDHKHNDGLSLLLEIESVDDNKNNGIKRFLLTGDNRYDVLPSHALRDIDVLLATHHGGTYDDVCNATNIPINTRDGLIVYSYGKDEQFQPYNNSHKHPSYRLHYQNAGWRNEKNTPNGNCIL